MPRLGHGTHIIPALCSMPNIAYYAQNYACPISTALLSFPLLHFLSVTSSETSYWDLVCANGRQECVLNELKVTPVFSLACV